MAGRPLDALALIGIGFRSLSVAPPAVGPLKEMIRSVRLESLTEYMDSLRNSGQRNLREILRWYARDHGIAISS
jgi:phosphotransferase system enzyme I (PtsP)